MKSRPGSCDSAAAHRSLPQFGSCLFGSCHPSCLWDHLQELCSVFALARGQYGGNTKDQNTQDIDSICRSWNAFHVCASSALAGCPGEAAAIWESLRQESRKTQFSGNLYDMCASRTTLPPSTLPPAPQSSGTSDQMNKETLKGQTHRPSPASISVLLPVCSMLLASLKS